MENKILFVETGDSFIVRSIAGNLEAMGIPCKIINWSCEEIEKNENQMGDVVVAYIEDASEVEQKALAYLVDACVEGDHGLCLVGHSDDVNELKRKYSLNNLAGEFYRPINAKEVADRIGSLVADNPSRHRKHILVVDDSGTMLNTIQEWLSDRYRVSVVNSAMNAISFLTKSIPDLILLDYEMPGCSGAQLLEMLRMNERTEDIPVIFLTGKDDQESVKSVLSLKPAGYLLKNMPKDYIIQQVDEFFEKQ